MAIGVQKPRDLLIEQAQYWKGQVVLILEGGTRDWKALDIAIENYKTHLVAADVLAGYMDKERSSISQAIRRGNQRFHPDHGANEEGIR